MRAAVDSELCNGCGICEIVCPEVFSINGGGKPLALVHGDPVPEEAVRFCRDARDCCKPGAIIIEDFPTSRPI